MRDKIKRSPESQAEVVRKAATDVIRNGVKSERDTQPVQVRMLKAQLAVLKQIANLEGRSSSEVIRELVDAYIAHCLKTWPVGDERWILKRTLKMVDYLPYSPEMLNVDLESPLDAVEGHYEGLDEGDAK